MQKSDGKKCACQEHQGGGEGILFSKDNKIVFIEQQSKTICCSYFRHTNSFKMGWTKKEKQIIIICV